MKRLKWLGLFAIVASLNSCIFFFLNNHDKIINDEYSLWVSFRDASGNDLVSGIYNDVTNGYEKSDICKAIDINFSDCGYYLSEYTSTGIDVVEWNNYYYLQFNLYSPVGKCPSSKAIDFYLKCPYVFGEDLALYPNGYHHINTHWEPAAKKSLYHLCNLIELDGKKITDITYENQYNERIHQELQSSLVTIILDRQ